MTDRAITDQRLSPLASQAALSKGRLHPEQSDRERSCFERDRDRVIHSAAFRKLQHKTQVFIVNEGDYYRTRLTHSLEVAQVTRSLCAALKLDQALGETIALAHDLGHTPFGHTGETALNDCLAANGWPAFNHNDQSFRILTLLEQRYPNYNGLNLTQESLEGIAKHNGPLSAPYPLSINAHNAKQDLDLGRFASLEAQTAAIADDIAYLSHDLEDGIRAGLLRLDQLDEQPLLAQLLAAIYAQHPQLSAKRVTAELVRRLLALAIYDVIDHTRKNLANLGAQNLDAVRNHHQALVSFSPQCAEQLAALKKYLFAKLYRHYRINRIRAKVTKVVSELFEFYMQRCDCLPDEWSALAQDFAPASIERARVITDYIAGMTDHYALKEHAIIFENNAVPQNFLSW